MHSKFSHESEELVINGIARQLKISLLHHSVLYFNSDADLPFLVYFIAQVHIFQLQKNNCHIHTRLRHDVVAADPKLSHQSTSENV